jgi:hypothetical protein
MGATCENPCRSGIEPAGCRVEQLDAEDLSAGVHDEYDMAGPVGDGKTLYDLALGQPQVRRRWLPDRG